jgi:hypothetical protein
MEQERRSVIRDCKRKVQESDYWRIIVDEAKAQKGLEPAKMKDGRFKRILK